MMTSQEIAQAVEAIKSIECQWDVNMMHGIEIAPGFFNIFDTQHGQSRVVIYHEPSDTIVKQASHPTNGYIPADVIGYVNIEGYEYPVRFVNSPVVTTESIWVEMQEYVRGIPCPCSEEMGPNGWCKHANSLSDIVEDFIDTDFANADTHMGNWRIAGDEVVIFDW